MTQKPSFRRELRLIIAGGRDFDDFSLMQQTLFNLFDKYRWRAKTDVITIISGCAKGADTLGIRYANMHHYRVKKFPADWDTYGKRAGFIRNKQMADFAADERHCGVLVAFWDGESRGTKNMIDTATQAGLEVHIIKY